MTNVSQVDQAIVLLQERLRRIRKEAAKTGAASTIKVQSTTVRSLHQLESLLALEGLPRKDLRRALVRSLLSEAFGQGVINDLAFHSMSDRITIALEADQDTRRILDDAITELRQRA